MAILSKGGLALLLFSGLMGLPHLLHSQCDTNQIANFYGKPEGGTDSVPSSKFLPGFGYEMHTDSGFTMYKVAEFKKNGTQIWLHGWCDSKTIRDLDAAQLADSTRTVAFTVNTGDSLSFYRELAWFNPIQLLQRPDNYYALDTLDYAVELVDAGTNSRLALLDSIGVLKKTPSGSPTIYGSRPIIAIASYIVPSALNGKSVFIRMKPYARGSGPFDFVRTDRWGMALSDRLNEARWQNYLNRMGGPSKSVALTQELTGSNAEAQLTAIPNPSSGEVSILFETPNDIPVSVIVYNLQGHPLFTPFYSPKGDGELNTVHMAFETSGTYFIALYHGETLTKSIKVTINK